MAAAVIILTGCKNEENQNDEIPTAISGSWVGTWTTAPQLVEPRNMPPQPGLSNNTLRQVVRVSLGGDSLRLRVSNEFSTDSTTLKAVEVAASEGGSAIDASTATRLTFNGSEEVTMAPGKAVYSDPVGFDLDARMDVAISIHFGEASEDVTGHPGSRTTSYLVEGNEITAPELAGAATADRWYIINEIDVKAPGSAAAVAVLGNSITDGRGSGTNEQNRWPDILSERLLENPGTENIGVLNQGIGGNCVLRFCLGPSGLDRFERDVLNQDGVEWLIIMEGINDIGNTGDSAEAFQVVEDLIEAYQQLVQKAHEEGIKVYGATLTPMEPSFYYTEYREAARDSINEWIRASGAFDAVIDFDKALRDPQNPDQILSDAHDGDHLHPNEKGYRMMAESIDLSLFD